LLTPEGVTGNSDDLADNHSGSCQANDGGEAVYRFLARADGVWCLDTRGSDYDTVLHVRAARCGDPEAEVVCQDDIDYPGNLQSEVALTTTAGMIYYVFVDSFLERSGAYVVNVSRGPCPGQ
jgi:hypothetical protein